MCIVVYGTILTLLTVIRYKKKHMLIFHFNYYFQAVQFHIFYFLIELTKILIKCEWEAIRISQEHESD